VDSITLLRAVNTALALAGVLVYAALLIRQKNLRFVRFFGFLGCFWLFVGYLYYWLSSTFPPPIFFTGAVTTMTSYILAGGIYALIAKWT
jgi:hypothetical protein